MSHDWLTKHPGSPEPRQLTLHPPSKEGLSPVTPHTKWGLRAVLLRQCVLAIDMARVRPAVRPSILVLYHVITGSRDASYVTP